VLKQFIVTAVLMIALAGPVAAQLTSATTQPAASSPATLTMVEACEAQARSAARMSKGLGANYNAAHVHDNCMANVAEFAANKH